MLSPKQRASRRQSRIATRVPRAPVARRTAANPRARSGNGDFGVSGWRQRFLEPEHGGLRWKVVRRGLQAACGSRRSSSGASTQRNRGRRKGCGRARAGRGGWPGGAGQAVWVSWKRWPWRPDARGIRSSAPASGPRAEPSPSPRRSPWRTACPPCPPAARPLAPS